MNELKDINEMSPPEVVKFVQFKSLEVDYEMSFGSFCKSKTKGKLRGILVDSTFAEETLILNKLCKSWSKFIDLIKFDLNREK